MKTKTQKRIIRAARKAKTLRLSRWNNVPHMRSRFVIEDLRAADHWSYAALAAARAAELANVVA